jgi:glycosyltransferase involved in cell wall biosynthesis
MNILHVIPSLAWERGGPSAVVRALVRHQTEAGHRVSILTTNQGLRHGQKPIDLGPGAIVSQLSVLGSDRIAYSPGFARAARAELRDVDVAHVHSIFTHPIHVALREARVLEVPAILRPCGQLHLYSLTRSRWQKWAYLKLWGRMVRGACRAWHYTSDHEAHDSWPWDSSPRFVLPNGIEPAEYDVDRARARVTVAKRWPQLGDAPYVLFLGRLHPKKRLDLLMEAFLAGSPAPAKLVVAGPDQDGHWDRLAASYLNNRAANGRVIRVEMVTGKDKINLLAGACLFALPSEHENFGIAALEALAVGTVALLSPHVDLAEAAVAEGIAYSAPLEAKVWSDQFASLLADIPALELLSDKARIWARDNYSWSYLASELTRHYESVTRGAGVPARINLAAR